MKRKFVTIKLYLDELAALQNMVDLGAQAVADAEHDHKEYTGRRRIGGYSADNRKAEKFFYRVFKKVTNIASYALIASLLSACGDASKLASTIKSIDPTLVSGPTYDGPSAVKCWSLREHPENTLVIQVDTKVLLVSAKIAYILESAGDLAYWPEGVTQLGSYCTVTIENHQIVGAN